ncbi:MAG: signal peptidase I [Actinobacteria bacterium]|nr:signal peptidase I [Actinomycetota bacterium]
MDDSAGILGGVFGTIIYLAIMAVAIAAMWRIYTKAGEPGWAAIIPIYNIIILLKIIGRPAWWIILMFIPIANFVVLILMMDGLSKSFGQGTGFTIGLIFLSIIFMAILGFGSARYVGPAAAA